MTVKGKLLIGLMALSLVGGVTTAFAAISRTGDTETLTENTDKAIYLDWDSASKTGITGITQLASGEKDYRSLSVILSKTTSLTGNVNVAFTLTPELSQEDQEAGKSATLSGMNLKVYETASKEDVSAENYTYDEEGETPKVNINGGTSNSSGNFNIALESGTSVTKHYVLVFTFSAVSLGVNDVFSGRLSVSQSYAPAA